MAIPIINKILSIIYLYCFNIYGRLYCICDYIHIVFPYCRGHIYRSQLYVYLPIIYIYICSFTHMMITITYVSRLIFCFSIFFLTCMMVIVKEDDTTGIDIINRFNPATFSVLIPSQDLDF
jgi:hypothetical protein